MSATPVHVVITGGTIDSEYVGAIDTVSPRDVSVVPRFLDGVKMSRPIECTTICMKDSRQINQDDRKAIVDAITSNDAKHVVVTHGTYTMPDTARFLEGALDVGDRIVILTGSMIPLEGFTMSDGGFNLGYAFSQLDVLSPGVYVCINGAVFSPNEVVKLLSEGRFGSLFAEDK